MTTKQWFEQAQRHADALRALVAKYHPASEAYNPAPLTITAGGPEALRQTFVPAIKRDCPKPLERFNSALEKNNWQSAVDVLEETGAGVPESIDCWGIPGFSECVDLLGDPPEDQPEDQDP